MNTKRIRITESELHRLIKESVNRILFEVSYYPGKYKDYHEESVPYDDDYIEMYGADEPSWTEEEEGRYEIREITQQLAQRIEFALEKFGLFGNVEVSENVETSNTHSPWYDIDMRVTWNYPKGGKLIDNGRKYNSKALSLITKILDYSKYVAHWEIKTARDRNAELNIGLHPDFNDVGRTFTKKNQEFDGYYSLTHQFD